MSAGIAYFWVGVLLITTAVLILLVLILLALSGVTSNVRVQDPTAV